MILKMDDYSYPSKEEWNKFSKDFPDIIKFGFPHIKEHVLIWDGHKSIKEVKVLQNLEHWDNLLNKKIWNLRQSYVNALVNYHRGIALEDDDFRSETKIINLFQYEMYCEMSFYYLISTRDILLQIINLAFDLELPEKSVGLNSISKKLETNDVFGLSDLITHMQYDLERANSIRNSMTHCFSKLEPDRRSTISSDGNTYYAGTGNVLKYNEQIDIMKNSLTGIRTFFDAIRSRLLLKGYLLDEM